MMPEMAWAIISRSIMIIVIIFSLGYRTPFEVHYEISTLRQTHFLKRKNKEKEG